MTKQDLDRIESDVSVIFRGAKKADKIKTARVLWKMFDFFGGDSIKAHIEALVEDHNSDVPLF